MQEIILFTQHHIALVIALVIVLILLAIFEYIKSKKSVAHLSPALATQMINHQNAVVLDIRTREIYTAGHIVNAISIPMAELEKNYHKLNTSKTQPIIVICGTGAESPIAASLLTQKGFNIFILANGMRGWKEADMPLIKDIKD